MTDRKTPLIDFHNRHQAKLVEFHGWELPLNYEGTGIIAEHKQTRDSCSLFDVSHMCQMRVSGEGVAESLNDILPLSATALKPGRNKYTFACDESGGIIDDMIVGNDEECFFIVCNASRSHVVSAHLKEHISEACELIMIEDRALIAIQGPKAEDTLAQVTPECREMRFMDSTVANYGGNRCRISRSGYTGEDGFEISILSEQADQFAERLLEGGACLPAGLGARDTLRIEAGLCLYGNDIDTSILPGEGSLEWAIPKSARKRASFIGAKPVLDQIEQGPPRKLVGLTVDGKSPVRQGTNLQADGKDAGTVTSGSHSPTLGRPIALALVASGLSEPGQVLDADHRGKMVKCEVTEMPFVKHRYKVSKAG